MCRAPLCLARVERASQSFSGSGHRRLRPLRGGFWNVVWIDVDEFNHPVTISTRRGCKQLHFGCTHDVNSLFERRTRPNCHVRTRSYETLVMDQPWLPLKGIVHG